MKIRVSIRQKLVIAYTSLIGLISLFIFIYFPASKEAEQIKALENRAEAIAEVMGSMLYPALVYEDNQRYT